MKENPIPDVSTTVLTARVPTDLHRRVKAKLAAKGMTFQGLILEAVERESGGRTKAANAAEGLPDVSPAFSADESAWIQKLTKLLRSDYGEAAQRQITTLYAAMLESGALTRVESALEAASRSDPRTQDLIAEALKAVRDVRSEIEAVERQIDIGWHDRASRKRDSEGGRRSLRRR